jgi:DNA-binding HxlR family transcriptional regulator
METINHYERLIADAAEASGQPRQFCRALISETLDLIANKWAVPILLELAGSLRAPVRFSELARAIPLITQKELTKQLRALEAAGLVERKVHPVVPPKVEYRLTARGASLKVVLDGLASWAAEHTLDIARSRAAYARRPAAD